MNPLDIVRAAFDFNSWTGWIGVLLILFVVGNVVAWWNEAGR